MSGRRGVTRVRVEGNAGERFAHYPTRVTAWGSASDQRAPASTLNSPLHRTPIEP
ncbi:hypothetical protein ACFV98_35135 [Streptomyces violascens]|uniref:hypothetical protein n=1 Tax=Streptomyces violascens TaxID=67381 RepID=UPI003658ABF8